MKLTIKHYSELTTDEFYDILKLRLKTFVVEQNCPYPEIDDADKLAYHLWLHDEDGIEAYARVLPKGAVFDDVAIGRVIAVKRRQGLGTEIVTQAIQVAKEKFAAEKITVFAQSYARGLYEKVGFKAVSDEFSEDGIPHIQMEYEVRA